MYENPSPKVIRPEGSLPSNKSLGCTQKAGSSRWVDVLRYGGAPEGSWSGY
ncbi:UxaA family hydrolase [Klebsiella pneumoniae]|nr:UxaA family hydrolase [Klebsiella pneumoniae]